jgi:nucleotide-binding universal stress UspA family protein
MKTLIATDGSSYATTAATTAAQLLRRAGNAFDVTCVIPDFFLPHGSKSTAGVTGRQTKYHEEMGRKTEQLLKDARQTLHASGIAAHGFTKTGSPADVLVKLAEDYDAVVVGTQNRTERPSPGLGPVASRIVEHVAGIVLVGRGLVNEKTFRILIGVDGSASSRNAVESFSSNFQAHKADITLMHVIEKPWLRLNLEEEWYSDVERSFGEPPEGERLFGRELQSEADQIVEEMRDRLSRSALSIETRISEGNPANELLREAEVGEYDLAVLGATGVSDLKHTLLGSVSFTLASYAPCSVAVIR